MKNRKRTFSILELFLLLCDSFFPIWNHQTHYTDDWWGIDRKMVCCQQHLPRALEIFLLRSTDFFRQSFPFSFIGVKNENGFHVRGIYSSKCVRIYRRSFGSLIVIIRNTLKKIFREALVCKNNVEYCCCWGQWAANLHTHTHLLEESGILFVGQRDRG